MTDLQKAIEAQGLRLDPKAMEAALAGARHLRAEVERLRDYLSRPQDD